MNEGDPSAGLAVPDWARRLVRTTPLIEAAPLGCALKLESLQRTGSFKLRGAALALGSLDQEARGRGVVTSSAGNHGLGLACAAAAIGARVKVIVPRTTPRVKRDAIAAFGAELVIEGGGYEEAEAAAKREAAATGAPFVSPYDDPRVIDGNGRWLAEELAGQAPSLRRVLVPVGGGGLIAGLASVLAPRGVEVVGVQPAANCAMHDSLAAGRALTDYRGGPTRCEGLEGAVGERAFRIARDAGVRVALVSEAAVLEAIAFAYRALGLLVEPSGAVGIAALRSGVVAPSPATAVVVTGSNLDPALLDEALATSRTVS